MPSWEEEMDREQGASKATPLVKNQWDSTIWVSGVASSNSVLLLTTYSRRRPLSLARGDKTVDALKQRQWCQNLHTAMCNPDSVGWCEMKRWRVKIYTETRWSRVYTRKVEDLKEMCASDSEERRHGWSWKPVEFGCGCESISMTVCEREPQ